VKIPPLGAEQPGRTQICEVRFIGMPNKAVGKSIKEGSPDLPKLPPRQIAKLVRLCIAGWLIPGFAHFLLGKKWRALILFAAIIGMFLFGLATKGEFYATGTGSYLEALGYFGEMCVGIGMPVAKFFGYAGDPLFKSADYGTAFLVAAGMLNALTLFDAYDIATGQKT
jgi:Family of unknown function (DUF6677)